MACPLCEVAAKRDAHASFIAELSRCVVLLGENQGCPGWCVLVLKDHVEHLDEMDGAVQRDVFGEVARVARAIRRVFPSHGRNGGSVRINYECLGNVEPHVHWHVIPRHANDPTPTKPVWGWSEAELRGTMSEAERRTLIVRLRRELEPATRTKKAP